MMGFQAPRSFSSQEEMSVKTLEVLKDLRRGGQQFSLQPGVWRHCQDSFLSPFFSVPFSLASSPFSSNIQRNSEKLGRSSGSLAVFPWSGWSFHWQDVLKPCIEPSLGVFSSEYWALECKTPITCFLFGSRFSS